MSLEKCRATNNTIIEIKRNNGEIVNGETQILKEIGEYYKNLYSENRHKNNEFKMKEFTDDIVVPVLSDEQMEECDKEIDINDVVKTIKNMKNGSAPGSDGIPVEFYKLFFEEIKDTLFDSYNYSFKNGILPTSQQLGIITLLHKDKKLERNNLDNWRPLSLTNVDYKILAKIIATRFQKVLKDIIHTDQSGFVKGRDIATLLREIDDLIEYDRRGNNDNILLATD